MASQSNAFAVPPGQQQQQQQAVAAPTSGGYPPHILPQQQQHQHQHQQQQAHPVHRANAGVAAPPHHPPSREQVHPQGYPQPQPQPFQQPARPPPPQQQQQSAHPSTPTPSVRSKKTGKPDKDEGRVLVTRAQNEETEDGRIRNREAMTKIRDAWIYSQARARQDEFTNYRPATVFVGTWNVNAKGKEEPLDAWLCKDWASTGGPPDVIAVGFQEIVDLNAVNVAVESKTTQRSQFWLDRILATLNSPKYVGNDPQNLGYTLIMQRSMVGLLICVLVKNVHRPRVRYVNATSVGVGVMGMLGNKGGVSVRMQFYDSTLVFVCTHLAAHRENVAGRNADFTSVYSRTFFEIGPQAIHEAIRSGSLSHWATGSSSVGIADHDIIIWLGDLNYRIDESMMTEKVLHLSEKGAFDELRVLDQLNIERKAGHAFNDFEEGPLNFPPTYKYQPGTDIYEQRPDKKLRAPAWCDRILWLAQVPEHVQQLTYGRSERPNVSDHKPVYSTMQVTYKDVVQPKREKVYEELMKVLDRFENQTLPMVGLDRVSLDFGEIRYGQSITLPIKITNTGSVVAQFRLVPKLDEAGICKSWMSVSPTYGMLIPGDEPASMSFKITLDNNAAQLINSGREVLEDILILRLENGRDYYITIKAAYARSCYGMSADDLVMCNLPVRNVPLDPIQRAEKNDASAASALCIPKELWRVVDAIYEKGMRTPYIFTESGLPVEVEQIRECLDTGAPFRQFRIHSYCEVLVSFLASLSSPIIPSQLFPTVEIDSQTIQMSARCLLEELPAIHYNIFVYMISFFREALMCRELNMLSAAKLARICCDCMAPGTNLDNSQNSLQKKTGMQLIMLHLLETSSI